MFKELGDFFTGGPALKEARQVIKRYGHKPKLSKENRQLLDNSRRINRRRFIRFSAAGTITALTTLTGVAYFTREQSGGGEEEAILTKPSPEHPIGQSILPEYSEIVIPIPAKAPQRVEVSNDTRFDAKYLKELLEDLKKPTLRNLDEVRKSLLENIAHVRTQKLGGTGIGTALRICESGYYLTAAHLFIDELSRNFEVPKKRADVYTPTDGAYASIKSVVVDGASDLAIFYAPSGKDRRKVAGLKLNDRILQPGEKLWLLGMVIESSRGPVQAILGIPFGTVDQNPMLKNSKGEETLLILVKDMIPYGGSSGGPVINSNGYVVAVESGFQLKEGTENSRRNYTHATVSPLSNLPRLNKAPINHLS